jgi:hypothetical protein
MVLVRRFLRRTCSEKNVRSHAVAQEIRDNRKSRFFALSNTPNVQVQVRRHVIRYLNDPCNATGFWFSTSARMTAIKDDCL